MTLGFTVYRVDTHRFSGNIIEAIAKALSKADLIVADLTGNNPNVLYELALAHSLGKKVLMVTNDRNTIPFDISMYRIEIIDHSSPEHVEDICQAMKDLILSSHVTGPLGGEVIYGENHFKKRFIAFLLDIAPFVVSFFCIAYLLGWERATSDDLIGGSIILLTYLYFTITTWAFSYTLGKRVMRLKVINLTGDKPSFVQCAARTTLIYLLPILTYGISILWALKGPGYRTLHDISTRTRVVRC